jgi:hypothetical protein
MSPQEFSRVCETMPVTGRFAGTTIQPHPYTPEDLAAVLQLQSGERFIFNAWEEFEAWYAQQHVQKRSRPKKTSV